MPNNDQSDDSDSPRSIEDASKIQLRLCNVALALTDLEIELRAISKEFVRPYARRRARMAVGPRATHAGRPDQRQLDLEADGF